jgi:parallel beta-helix repeat protein
MVISVAGANVVPAAVASSPAAVAASNCGVSLQSLVDAAPAGATVQVPGCIFRETLRIDKSLTLIGQPGTEIRGSDVWSAWSPRGAAWVSDQIVPALPAAGNQDGRCAEASNRCLLPQQVFVDDQPLLPVPFGVQPTGGQFALDADRHVVLAQNPNSHTVEVSTRQHWIITAADGVTIQSIAMRHAANDAQTGGVSNNGFSNWTLRDSRLANAHGAVVDMQHGANLRLLGNDISGGGDLGVHAAQFSSGLVQSNHIHDNNRDQFNPSWEAGGLKAADVHRFVMDNNEVDANAASGLWCDIASTDVTYSNNRVHHNLTQGIIFEISTGATVTNNAVWENGWGAPDWGWGGGIVVSTSSNVVVANNLVAWNRAGISIIEQARTDGAPVRNIDVHDNVIMRDVVPGDYWSNLSLAWLNDTTGALYEPAANNRGTNNLFWYDQPETDSVRVAWRQQYARLSDSGTTPGEQGGRYLTDIEKDQLVNARAIPGAAGQQNARIPPG